MIRRYWRHVLAVIALLVLAIALLLWSRATAAQNAEHSQLTDGSPLTLVKPGKAPAAGPELMCLPAAKLLCVYGKEEINENGRAEKPAPTKGSSCPAATISTKISRPWRP
nr:hypothetical protein [Pseudomonas sp. 2FE]